MAADSASPSQVTTLRAPERIPEIEPNPRLYNTRAFYTYRTHTFKAIGVTSRPQCDVTYEARVGGSRRHTLEQSQYTAAASDDVTRALSIGGYDVTYTVPDQWVAVTIEAFHLDRRYLPISTTDVTYTRYI